jgi:hypothetical protein
MNLADFLLARIAEDEQIARQILGPYFGDQWMTFAWASDPEPVDLNQARLLAECDAKRRILELHARTDFGLRRFGCVICNELEAAEGAWGGGDAGPCDTIRALALPYADHRDYRDEWRP